MSDPAVIVTADAVTFEQGHESAPDAPWGLQRVRLSRAGNLDYERTQRGATTAVRGRVEGAKVDSLLSVLAGTTFPDPPQSSFPPGSSVCRISIGASWVDVEYYSGLRLPGYGEVLKTLNDLTTALRVSDAEGLARWSFVANES